MCGRCGASVDSMNIEGVQASSPVTTTCMQSPSHSPPVLLIPVFRLPSILAQPAEIRDSVYKTVPRYLQFSAIQTLTCHYPLFTICNKLFLNLPICVFPICDNYHDYNIIFFLFNVQIMFWQIEPCNSKRNVFF